MAIHIMNILKAIGVRLFLTLHVVLCVWRVTENYNNVMYWLLALGLVPFYIEALFNIIKRQGREFLRFSPCFFLYLAALLPGIWLLELDKSERYRHGTQNTLDMDDNSTKNEPVPVPDLNPGMWILIIEEFMPYVIIISRWCLPRGRVTREQLSELLFAFIGIAADIMEFFSLFGEEQVRLNSYMGYWVLGVWSWAIMQFTMTITVVQQPKRAKKIKYIRRVDPEEEEEKEKVKHEIFAIFLSMCMQDLPFVVTRLYTIATFRIINYSLLFFTSKNLLIISLLFYKVAVLCCKGRCSEYEDDESDDEEKIKGGVDDVDNVRKPRVSTASIPRKPRDSTASMPLTDFSEKGRANHAYAHDNDNRFRKRSDQPRSNGRPSDPRRTASVPQFALENINAAPHREPQPSQKSPEPQPSQKSPEPQPSQKSREPQPSQKSREPQPSQKSHDTPKGSATSSPAVSRSSPKASKASSVPSESSPVAPKASPDPDSGDGGEEMPRNESMFGWINDESVTDPSDGRDEGSEKSFNSESTRLSPVASVKSQPPAQEASPDPSPDPSPEPSPPQTSRHTPAPSISSQNSRPGDPDFKPLVSVIKI